MTGWRLAAEADDIRVALSAITAPTAHCAIATLVEISGSAPRDPGAQMMITDQEYWGFLSGGCIEDDVARHGREAMASGQPRLLRYGEGSPWIDIKLACGSGITVLVEPARLDEPALQRIAENYRLRAPITLSSDGMNRTASAAAGPADFVWDGSRYSRLFEPALRLILIGTDATALATARLARELGLDVVLVAPGGPAQPPFDRIGYYREHAAAALAAIGLDRWSAVAVLSHDREDDEAALAHALTSDAFYVGAIGARARLAARYEKLRGHGVSDDRMAGLHAPIGLQGFGKAPRDIALSLLAEVAREFHARSAAARSPGASMSSIAPAASVAR